MKKSISNSTAIAIVMVSVITTSCEMIKNCKSPDLQHSKLNTTMKNETCSKCGKTSCDDTCSSNPAASDLETNAKRMEGCESQFTMEEKQIAEKLLKSGFIKRIKSINELEKGYELVYDEPLTFALQLLEIVGLEKKCASDYTLALVFDPKSTTMRYQYTASNQDKKDALKNNFITLGLGDLLEQNNK